jgi:AraC-like DNA-binding protein
MRSPRPTPAEAPAFVSAQVTAARRFYLNLKPRPTRGLTVVCGGWEECAIDYTIDRKTFPYPSVEFVAAGRGDLVLAGKRHELSPGTLFSYGPGISHRIRTSADAPLKKYFVNFAGGRASTLLRDSDLKPGTLARLGTTTEVRNAFDTLVRFGTLHDRHTARTCALQLELLLLSAIRANQPSSPSARRSMATFERCRAHIEQHFLELTTLQQSAAACHVDEAYLCRLFQRFQGETPYRYLQRLQMQWAAERFTRPAASSGRSQPIFASIQFSRTFKRIHGVSPTAFLGPRG